MNVELAVIADDITGAADTSVKFRGCFKPIYLINHTNTENLRFKISPSVISMFTNTRGLSIPETKNILQRTTNALQTLQPKWFYKKVDSCMRGTVGVECSLLLSFLNMKACFIAPAYPVQDRITVHDIHLVGGKPVAETEIGCDPVCPVKESSLTKLLRASHRHKVGHVEIRFLEGSRTELYSEVARLISSGNRLIGFDATSEEHLKKIAELAITRFPDVLLVGSAGLATAIAGQLNDNRGKGKSIQPAQSIRHTGNLLLVCGSPSETLKQQISALQNSCHCETIDLEPEILVNRGAEYSRENLAARLRDILSNSSLVVRIKSSTQAHNRQHAVSLLRGLSELMQYLIELCPPSVLFMSGGDTASAVLDRFNPYPLRIDKEITDGIVATTALEGLLSSRTIVMKAGALGIPRSLVELYHYYYGKGEISEERRW